MDMWALPCFKTHTWHWFTDSKWSWCFFSTSFTLKLAASEVGTFSVKDKNTLYVYVCTNWGESSSGVKAKQFLFGITTALWILKTHKFLFADRCFGKYCEVWDADNSISRSKQWVLFTSLWLFPTSDSNSVEALFKHKCIYQCHTAYFKEYEYKHQECCFWGG